MDSAGYLETEVSAVSRETFPGYVISLLDDIQTIRYHAERDRYTAFPTFDSRKKFQERLQALVGQFVEAGFGEADAKQLKKQALKQLADQLHMFLINYPQAGLFLPVNTRQQFEENAVRFLSANDFPKPSLSPDRSIETSTFSWAQAARALLRGKELVLTAQRMKKKTSHPIIQRGERETLSGESKQTASVFESDGTGRSAVNISTAILLSREIQALYDSMAEITTPQNTSNQPADECRAKMLESLRQKVISVRERVRLMLRRKGQANLREKLEDGLSEVHQFVESESVRMFIEQRGRDERQGKNMGVSLFYQPPATYHLPEGTVTIPRRILPETQPAEINDWREKYQHEINLMKMLGISSLGMSEPISPSVISGQEQTLSPPDHGGKIFLPPFDRVSAWQVGAHFLIVYPARANEKSREGNDDDHSTLGIGTVGPSSINPDWEEDHSEQRVTSILNLHSPTVLKDLRDLLGNLRPYRILHWRDQGRALWNAITYLRARLGWYDGLVRSTVGLEPMEALYLSLRDFAQEAPYSSLWMKIQSFDNPETFAQALNAGRARRESIAFHTMIRALHQEIAPVSSIGARGLPSLDSGTTITQDVSAVTDEESALLAAAACVDTVNHGKTRETIQLIYHGIVMRRDATLSDRVNAACCESQSGNVTAQSREDIGNEGKKLPQFIKAYQRLVREKIPGAAKCCSRLVFMMQQEERLLAIKIYVEGRLTKKTQQEARDKVKRALNAITLEGIEPNDTFRLNEGVMGAVALWTDPTLKAIKREFTQQFFPALKEGFSKRAAEYQLAEAFTELAMVVEAESLRRRVEHIQSLFEENGLQSTINPWEGLVKKIIEKRDAWIFTQGQETEAILKSVRDRGGVDDIEKQKSRRCDERLLEALVEESAELGSGVKALAEPEEKDRKKPSKKMVMLREWDKVLTQLEALARDFSRMKDALEYDEQQGSVAPDFSARLSCVTEKNTFWERVRKALENSELALINRVQEQSALLKKMIETLLDDEQAMLRQLAERAAHRAKVMDRYHQLHLQFSVQLRLFWAYVKNGAHPVDGEVSTLQSMTQRMQALQTQIQAESDDSLKADLNALCARWIRSEGEAVFEKAKEIEKQAQAWRATLQEERSGTDVDLALVLARGKAFVCFCDLKVEKMIEALVATLRSLSFGVSTHGENQQPLVDVKQSLEQLKTVFSKLEETQREWLPAQQKETDDLLRRQVDAGQVFHAAKEALKAHTYSLTAAKSIEDQPAEDQKSFVLLLIDIKTKRTILEREIAVCQAVNEGEDPEPAIQARIDRLTKMLDSDTLDRKTESSGESIDSTAAAWRKDIEGQKEHLVEALRILQSQKREVEVERKARREVLDEAKTALTILRERQATHVKIAVEAIRRDAMKMAEIRPVVEPVFPHEEETNKPFIQALQTLVISELILVKVFSTAEKQKIALEAERSKWSHEMETRKIDREQLDLTDVLLGELKEANDDYETAAALAQARLDEAVLAAKKRQVEIGLRQQRVQGEIVQLRRLIIEKSDSLNSEAQRLTDRETKLQLLLKETEAVLTESDTLDVRVFKKIYERVQTTEKILSDNEPVLHEARSMLALTETIVGRIEGQVLEKEEPSIIEYQKQSEWLKRKIQSFEQMKNAVKKRQQEVIVRLRAIIAKKRKDTRSLEHTMWELFRARGKAYRRMGETESHQEGLAADRTSRLLDLLRKKRVEHLRFDALIHEETTEIEKLNELKKRLWEMGGEKADARKPFKQTGEGKDNRSYERNSYEEEDIEGNSDVASHASRFSEAPERKVVDDRLTCLAREYADAKSRLAGARASVDAAIVIIKMKRAEWEAFQQTVQNEIQVKNQAVLKEADTLRAYANSLEALLITLPLGLVDGSKESGIAEEDFFEAYQCVRKISQGLSVVAGRVWEAKAILKQAEEVVGQWMESDSVPEYRAAYEAVIQQMTRLENRATALTSERASSMMALRRLLSQGMLAVQNVQRTIRNNESYSEKDPLPRTSSVSEGASLDDLKGALDQQLEAEQMLAGWQQVDRERLVALKEARKMLERLTFENKDPSQRMIESNEGRKRSGSVGSEKEMESSKHRETIFDPMVKLEQEFNQYVQRVNHLKRCAAMAITRVEKRLSELSIQSERLATDIQNTRGKAEAAWQRQARREQWQRRLDTVEADTKKWLFLSRDFVGGIDSDGAAEQTLVLTSGQRRSAEVIQHEWEVREDKRVEEIDAMARFKTVVDELMQEQQSMEPEPSVKESRTDPSNQRLRELKLAVEKRLEILNDVQESAAVYRKELNALQTEFHEAKRKAGKKLEENERLLVRQRTLFESRQQEWESVKAEKAKAIQVLQASVETIEHSVLSVSEGSEWGSLIDQLAKMLCGIIPEQQAYVDEAAKKMVELETKTEAITNRDVAEFSFSSEREAYEQIADNAFRSIFNRYAKVILRVMNDHVMCTTGGSVFSKVTNTFLSRWLTMDLLPVDEKNRLQGCLTRNEAQWGCLVRSAGRYFSGVISESGRDTPQNLQRFRMLCLFENYLDKISERIFQDRSCVKVEVETLQEASAFSRLVERMRELGLSSALEALTQVRESFPEPQGMDTEAQLYREAESQLIHDIVENPDDSVEWVVTLLFQAIRGISEMVEADRKRMELSSEIAQMNTRGLREGQQSAEVLKALEERVRKRVNASVLLLKEQMISRLAFTEEKLAESLAIVDDMRRVFGASTEIGKLSIESDASKIAFQKRADQYGEQAVAIKREAATLRGLIDSSTAAAEFEQLKQRISLFQAMDQSFLSPAGLVEEYRQDFENRYHAVEAYQLKIGVLESQWINYCKSVLAINARSDARAWPLIESLSANDLQTLRQKGAEEYPKSLEENDRWIIVLMGQLDTLVRLETNELSREKMHVVEGVEQSDDAPSRRVTAWEAHLSQLEEKRQQLDKLAQGGKMLRQEFDVWKRKLEKARVGDIFIPGTSIYVFSGAEADRREALMRAKTEVERLVKAERERLEQDKIAAGVRALESYRNWMKMQSKALGQLVEDEEFECTRKKLEKAEKSSKKLTKEAVESLRSILDWASILLEDREMMLKKFWDDRFQKLQKERGTDESLKAVLDRIQDQQKTILEIVESPSSYDGDETVKKYRAQCRARAATLNELLSCRQEIEALAHRLQEQQEHALELLSVRREISLMQADISITEAETVMGHPNFGLKVVAHFSGVALKSYEAREKLLVDWLEAGFEASKEVEAESSLTARIDLSSQAYQQLERVRTIREKVINAEQADRIFEQLRASHIQGPGAGKPGESEDELRERIQNEIAKETECLDRCYRAWVGEESSSEVGVVGVCHHYSTLYPADASVKKEILLPVLDWVDEINKKRAFLDKTSTDLVVATEASSEQTTCSQDVKDTYLLRRIQLTQVTRQLALAQREYEGLAVRVERKDSSVDLLRICFEDEIQYYSELRVQLILCVTCPGDRLSEVVRQLEHRETVKRRLVEMQQLVSSGLDDEIQYYTELKTRWLSQRTGAFSHPEVQAITREAWKAGRARVSRRRAAEVLCERRKRAKSTIEPPPGLANNTVELQQAVAKHQRRAQQAEMDVKSAAELKEAYEAYVRSVETVNECDRQRMHAGMPMSLNGQAEQRNVYLSEKERNAIGSPERDIRLSLEYAEKEAAKWLNDTTEAFIRAEKACNDHLDRQRASIIAMVKTMKALTLEARSETQELTARDETYQRSLSQPFFEEGDRHFAPLNQAGYAHVGYRVLDALSTIERSRRERGSEIVGNRDPEILSRFTTSKVMGQWKSDSDLRLRADRNAADEQAMLKTWAIQNGLLVMGREISSGSLLGEARERVGQDAAMVASSYRMRETVEPLVDGQVDGDKAAEKKAALAWIEQRSIVTTPNGTVIFDARVLSQFTLIVCWLGALCALQSDGEALVTKKIMTDHTEGNLAEQQLIDATQRFRLAVRRLGEEFMERQRELAGGEAGGDDLICIQGARKAFQQLNEAVDERVKKIEETQERIASDLERVGRGELLPNTSGDGCFMRDSQGIGCRLAEIIYQGTVDEDLRRAYRDYLAMWEKMPEGVGGRISRYVEERHRIFQRQVIEETQRRRILISRDEITQQIDRESEKIRQGLGDFSERISEIAALKTFDGRRLSEESFSRLANLEGVVKQLRERMAMLKHSIEWVHATSRKLGGYLVALGSNEHDEYLRCLMTEVYPEETFEAQLDSLEQRLGAERSELIKAIDRERMDMSVLREKYSGLIESTIVRIIEERKDDFKPTFFSRRKAGVCDPKDASFESKIERANRSELSVARAILREKESEQEISFEDDRGQGPSMKKTGDENLIRAARQIKRAYADIRAQDDRIDQLERAASVAIPCYSATSPLMGNEKTELARLEEEITLALFPQRILQAEALVASLSPKVDALLLQLRMTIAEDTSQPLKEAIAHRVSMANQLKQALAAMNEARAEEEVIFIARRKQLLSQDMNDEDGESQESPSELKALETWRKRWWERMGQVTRKMEALTIHLNTAENLVSAESELQQIIHHLRDAIQKVHDRSSVGSKAVAISTMGICPDPGRAAIADMMDSLRRTMTLPQPAAINTPIDVTGSVHGRSVILLATSPPSRLLETMRQVISTRLYPYTLLLLTGCGSGPHDGGYQAGLIRIDVNGRIEGERGERMFAQRDFQGSWLAGGATPAARSAIEETIKTSLGGSPIGFTVKIQGSY